MLREAFPAIGPDDRVLVWGGGLWSWLDPLTPMRAAARLAGEDVHLVLMGAGRPGIEATGQAAGRGAGAGRRRGRSRTSMSRRLGPIRRAGPLAGRRGSRRLRARDHLEARYAHRTRVLDYLWAGLPVVATRGDALADLVSSAKDSAARRRRAIRRRLPTRARELLGPAGAAARERVAAVAPSLHWDVVAAPLVDWCATAAEHPRRAPARGVLRRATVAGYGLALAETLADDGPAAAVRRVGRRLRRAVTLR